MIRDTSVVTALSWAAHRRQRVAIRTGRIAPGRAPETTNTACPVIDRGRAVCGPWYHPGSSRPHGARPWLHGDTVDMARCIDAVTGVTCSVRSTRRRLLRRCGHRWFGARLEGLLRWRSGSRFAATAVLLLVPARYSSLSSPVDGSVVMCILPAVVTNVKRGDPAMCPQQPGHLLVHDGVQQPASTVTGLWRSVLGRAGSSQAASR